VGADTTKLTLVIAWVLLPGVATAEAGLATKAIASNAELKTPTIAKTLTNVRFIALSLVSLSSLLLFLSLSLLIFIGFRSVFAVRYLCGCGIILLPQYK